MLWNLDYILQSRYIKHLSGVGKVWLVARARMEACSENITQHFVIREEGMGIWRFREVVR